MIHSFLCSDTEALFLSKSVSRFKNIERVARRKLLQLHAVTRLEDLKIPPGNHLELLKKIVKDSTVFVSTISGVFVLFGS